MIRRERFRILSEEEKRKCIFEFCHFCPIVDCELLKGYMTIRQNNPDMTYPSYCQNELANGCVLNRDNLVLCGNKRVSDGIGDDFKYNLMNDYSIETETDKWEPIQPVFISAQTGYGKNYFIENTLLEYVRQLNQKNVSSHKILILSNRLALQKQVEDRMGHGNYSDEDLDSTIFKYKDHIDVMTYQSVLTNENRLKRIQKMTRSRYTFIICDEAHFFTSDAMFNCDTERILSSLVKVFKDAIRVYMTATPYECLKYIDEHETHKSIFYHFTRNYDYFDIEYYSEFDELAKEIVNNLVQKKENWIIFIDDKDKCDDMKMKIIDYGNTINESMGEKIYIANVESKNNIEYQEMILKEKFIKEIKVLITTSVLDNGVNLRKINNIVLSDIQKVKCLQMVGRARVEYDLDMKPLERKKLFVKSADSKTIIGRINAL